jgi:uncharacterized protein YfdQ (DUF2303 family)
MTEESDVGAALEYVARTEAVRLQDADLAQGDGHVTLLTTPNGVGRSVFDLEAYLPAPRRSVGTVGVHTAPAFVNLHAALVNEPNTARLYADEPNQVLECVLNDDWQGVPGWRDHRIVLVLRHTPEWEFWRDHAGLRPLEAFGEIIEEGLPEIVEPTAADMLELAQTFSVATQARFRQGARLRDGRRQFTYEEDHDAAAGDAGDVVIPESFILQVEPFVGSSPKRVVARLRWRLDGGKLGVGYQLVRPHVVERMAFAEVVASVTDAVGPAVEGVAPDPRRPHPVLGP